MKSLLIATISVAVACVAAPVLAQDAPSVLGPVTTYGTLGYSNIDGNSVDLSAAQARLGARFGRYLGVEGELSGGLNSDHAYPATGQTKVGLNDQTAIYGVGYLPLLPNADLFARVGYGRTDAHVSDSASATSYRFGEESWNYGAGGQYFFKGGPNGVRVDYTRYDYEHSLPDANVWSVAYVRKF